MIEPTNDGGAIRTFFFASQSFFRRLKRTSVLVERENDRFKFDPDIAPLVPYDLGVIGRAVANIDDVDAPAKPLLRGRGNARPRFADRLLNAQSQVKVPLPVNDQAGKQDAPAGGGGVVRMCRFLGSVFFGHREHSGCEQPRRCAKTRPRLPDFKELQLYELTG